MASGVLWAAGCAAAGLLLWPGAGTVRRRRLRALRPGPPSGFVVTGRAARWPVAPSRTQGAQVCAGAGVLAGAVTAAVSTVLVAGLAAGCAALLVRSLLHRRSARTGALQLRALAEALGVLAAEIRAGRSMSAATGTAVAGCPDPPVAAALGAAVRLPAARAATAPAAAASDVDRALSRVSAAVELSARTGCSLAGVVGAVEDDLRARLQAADDLRSAVSGPRASTAVLAGLPVLGLAMGAGVGADPWGVLTTTRVGQLLLVAGVGLEVAGLAWSSRLVARAVRA